MSAAVVAAFTLTTTIGKKAPLATPLNVTFVSPLAMSTTRSPPVPTYNADSGSTVESLFTTATALLEIAFVSCSKLKYLPIFLFSYFVNLFFFSYDLAPAKPSIPSSTCIVTLVFISGKSTDHPFTVNVNLNKGSKNTVIIGKV